MSRFYFAWVDAGTPFSGALHVEDEKIAAFVMNHKEGDIPTLSIDIKNPNIGLLHPGRKVWAWLAYDDGNSHVQPIFFGRLVGIPTNLNAKVCTLTFIGKPINFQAQKLALSTGMKVSPFYDPLFIDPTLVDDPDTILNGYSKLWHVARNSMTVSASDIIVGEDGEQEFLDNEVPSDSVQITLGQSPLSSIHIKASVNWTQVATGNIDMNPGIFEDESAGDLISNWPKVGTDLGSGWSVASASATDFWHVNDIQMVTSTSTYTNTQTEHNEGDTMSSNLTVTYPNIGELDANGDPISPTNLPIKSLVPFRVVVTSNAFQTGITDPDSDPPINIPSSFTTTVDYFITYHVPTTLVLTYKAARARRETVSFTMQADVQAIATLPSPLENSEVLTIQGRNVDAVMPDASVPIVDASRSSYFPTDRGQQSVQYLLALGRAHLLLRSRAIQVSWDCRFERAIALSCRMNARLHDPSLPGGTALGKIVAYSFSGDGDAGALIGKVTIACAVGFGNAISSDRGIGEYVADGYVQDGYQIRDGGITVLASGDIAYTRPLAEVTDDGLVFPLRKGDVVVDETITSATYRLELKPVTNGPFDALYNIAVSQLTIPKQIDLEAHSS